MRKDEHGLQIRIAGTHAVRLDGMQDIYSRMAGASVFDIGSNKGAVSMQAAELNAAVCHGCDIYEQGIISTRDWFADHSWIKSKFEVVDLTKGPSSLEPFAAHTYDIVLMLATYHKIKRIMSADDLSALMRHIGKMTKRYFCWRATSDKPDENEQEIVALDRDMRDAGLQRIHTSYISRQLGVAAIWERR